MMHVFIMSVINTNMFNSFWYHCFSIAFASNVVATVHMSQQVYFVFTMLIYFQLQLQNMPAMQEGMPSVVYAQHHVFSSVMHQYDVRLPYPAIVHRQ